MKKEFGPFQEKTAKALAEYKQWLQNDLLPRSDGDFRLGQEKYRKKLRFTLTSDLSMEEILKRAQADLNANPGGDVRNGVAALPEIFPERRKSGPRATKRKLSRQCWTSWRSNIRTTARWSSEGKKIVNGGDRFCEAP